MSHRLIGDLDNRQKIRHQPKSQLYVSHRNAALKVPAHRLKICRSADNYIDYASVGRNNLAVRMLQVRYPKTFFG